MYNSFITLRNALGGFMSVICLDVVNVHFNVRTGIQITI